MADSGSTGEEEESPAVRVRSRRPGSSPGSAGRDGGLVRPVAVLAALSARGSSAASGRKGGMSWPRASCRNRLIRTLRAAGL